MQVKSANLLYTPVSHLVGVTPCPSDFVMPGILWGCSSELFTPAFWKFHTNSYKTRCKVETFELGNSLLEEVAVCLLGGYGLPAELGLAAFHRLRNRNLLRPETEQGELERALYEPLHCGGRERRYRFPRQKAKFLWHALQAIEHLSSSLPPRELRDRLTRIPGIGPKTASWIVRNHCGSNEVAILDVHILRAGLAIGLFSPNSNPSRNYYRLENRFLEFCSAIEEPASLVDAIMWDYMRRIGRLFTYQAPDNQHVKALFQ